MGLSFESHGFSVGIDCVRVNEQDDVPDTEFATGAYDDVRAYPGIELEGTDQTGDFCPRVQFNGRGTAQSQLFD